MRIRLSISRYSLGTTKIWWDTASVNEGRPGATFSMLLESVNEVCQLETETWGLEDYVVEVGGWEMLHFQGVQGLLKEGDEVVIRPLDGHEIRERRRIGRRQISTTGRKLVDGVPFGRTFLGLRKASDRPQVGILEPGKRRRLEDGTAKGVRFEDREEGGDDDEDYYQEEEADGEIVRQVGWTYPELGEGQDDDDDDDEEEEEDDDDDEEDENYREEDSGSESGSDEEARESEAGGDVEAPVETSRLTPKTGKEVPKVVAKGKDQVRTAEGKVKQSQALVSKITSSVSGKSSSSSPSSSSSDSDSEVESTKSSSSPSSDSDSDSESDRDFDASSASDSDSESDSNSDSNSSSSSSSPSLSSNPVRKKLKAASNKSVLQQPAKLTASTITPGTPHTGSRQTTARNERLRRAKARRQLVSAGILPPDSSNIDLVKWLGEHPEGVQAYSAKMKKGYVELRKDTPPVEGEVEAAVPIRAAVNASVVAVPTPSPTTPGAPQAAPTATKQLNSKEAKKAKKNEKKKRAQQRKRALAGTPAQQNPSMAAVTAVQTSATAAPISAAVPPSGTEITPRDPEQGRLNNQWIKNHAKNASNKKKGFLNKMAGLLPKKYIYDEQGNRVEVPTTLANFSGTPGAYEDDVEQEQEEQSEKNGCLDAWRSRIVLSAVECEDEEFGAPQPTFPFVQPGWRRNGNTTQPVAGKKRKRGKGKRDHRSHYGYEHRQFDGASDGADDGAGDDWDNYNYYEDEPVVGSAMKAQAKKADNARAATQKEVEEEDLPELPADVTTLVKLTKDQVVSGAVVAFKQLTMDANYSPIMSDYRTALITEVVEEMNGELALWMKLARRDRPKKRYDEETGERLFGKFEIPGEEGDDDEVMDIMFGDMIEPRVVKPAEGLVKSVVAELDMEATPVQISGNEVMGDGGQEPLAAEEQDDGKTGGEVNNLSNNLNQEERGLITENATGAEAMDLDNQDHVMLSAVETAAGPEGIEDEAEKGIDRDREMVDVRTDEGVVAVQEEDVRMAVAVAVAVEQQVLGEVGDVEGRMQPRQVQNNSQLQKKVERESEKDVLGGIVSLWLDRSGAQSAGAEAVTGDGGTIDSSVRQKSEKEQHQEEEEVLPVVNSGAPVMASAPYTTSYTVQSPQYTPWADDEIENILDQGLPPRVNPATSIEVGKEVEEGSQVDRQEKSSNDAPLPEEFRIPDSSQSSSIAQEQTETPLPQLPPSTSSEESNAQPPQDSPHSELPKQRPPPTLTRQDSWDDELPELDERGYLITKSQKASSQLKPLIKEEKKQPKQSTPADSTAVVPLKTTAKVASSSSEKAPADTIPPPTVTPKKRVVGRKTITGPRVRPSLTGIKAVEKFTPDDLIPPPSTAPARVSGASAGQLNVSSSSKRSSSIASASASSSTPTTGTEATTKVRGPAGSAAKNRQSAGGTYIIDLTESGDEDEKSTLPSLPLSQPVARPREMYDVPPPSSQPQQKQVKEVKEVKQVISSESLASVSGSSSMTLMEDGTWRSAVKPRKF